VTRTSMHLMAWVGFGALLLLVASAHSQPPGGAPAPGVQPVQQSMRPTIAVFNMAAVMKDYGKAKYKVWELNEEKKKLTIELVELKGRIQKIQGDVVNVQDPAAKERMVKEQREYVRIYEDKDREITKQLNDKASAIISSLYDDIKLVVDKTAEMNGYHIVFAYPDATNAEEMKTAYVKELKLKPPAAQPFYVAKQVDITNVVVQTLNTWYTAPAVPATPPAPPPQGQGSPPAAPPPPGPGARQ
jgi:Skp family chaperone for outer membrane proteins